MGIGFQFADRLASILPRRARGQRRDGAVLAAVSRRNSGRGCFHGSEPGETTHLGCARNGAIRAGPRFGAQRSWAMKSPMRGLGGMAPPLSLSLVRGPSRSHGDGPPCKPGRVVGEAPRRGSPPTMAAGVRGSAGPSLFDCGWKGIRSAGSSQIRWAAHAGGTGG